MIHDWITRWIPVAYAVQAKYNIPAGHYDPSKPQDNLIGEGGPSV